MYTVADYVYMLSDDRRVAAYTQAIQALVRPGDRVLDIGTGFGFFAVIAARAGAQRVDAVDINPAIRLGPEVARLNACAHQIHFQQIDARQLVLDAPADVVIADLRGATPFSGQSLDVLRDVRRRLLKEGGTMIAARDVLFCAPVSAPEKFVRDVAHPLASTGVRLDPAAEVLRAMPMRLPVAPADLLAPAQSWWVIDYRSHDIVDGEGCCEWTMERGTELHGLALWFESEVGGGASFSTRPDGTRGVYRQLFLPLQAPQPVDHGDVVSVMLEARAAADDYLWVWSVSIRSADGRVRAASRQTSLASRVADAGVVAKAAL